MDNKSQIAHGLHSEPLINFEGHLWSIPELRFAGDIVEVDIFGRTGSFAIEAVNQSDISNSEYCSRVPGYIKNKSISRHCLNNVLPLRVRTDQFASSVPQSFNFAADRFADLDSERFIQFEISHLMVLEGYECNDHQNNPGQRSEKNSALRSMSCLSHVNHRQSPEFGRT
jgi:hypothetical protein